MKKRRKNIIFVTKILFDMSSKNPLRIEEEEISVLSDLGGSAILFLHNDDYNTFDFVIDCLIKICEHDAIQAEQCAWIVHTCGKCDIKHGERVELMKFYKALKSKGLIVTLD